MEGFLLLRFSFFFSFFLSLYIFICIGLLTKAASVKWIGSYLLLHSIVFRSSYLIYVYRTTSVLADLLLKPFFFFFSTEITTPPFKTLTAKNSFTFFSIYALQFINILVVDKNDSPIFFLLVFVSNIF